MTDYFSARRLIQLLEEHLMPKGYVFTRWCTRGEDHEDQQVYEFVFITPGGRQEIATGISRYELETTSHKLTTIAGVLKNRVLKKMEEVDASNPSP